MSSVDKIKWAMEDNLGCEIENFLMLDHNRTYWNY